MTSSLSSKGEDGPGAGFGVAVVGEATRLLGAISEDFSSSLLETGPATAERVVEG